VKELTCLYSISGVLNRQDLPFEDLLQEVSKILPSGMQVPGTCGARIRMGGKEWTSAGFSETPWKLSEEIPGEGEFHGSIDVCYASDRAGPERALFLDEERQLLKEVALRLAETKRHRSADEVRSRLASIVECAEEAIIGKDLEGTILSWNRGAERIYGYQASEVIGRPIAILLPDGYPNDIPSILERMRRGERLEHFETSRIRKDGRIIQVDLSVSPVMDSTGRITGISTMARDLSNSS
jgi:PAS domain S-box-containing protein